MLISHPLMRGHIFTSYFSNIYNLRDYTLISISRFSPAGFHGLSYISLAPSKKLLYNYKNKKLSKSDYFRIFKEETLSQLNPQTVLDELYSLQIPDSKGLVLLCYEKPKDFCHRHFVASWLNFGCKLFPNITEYGAESE